MGKYKIQIKKSAEKELRKIPKKYLTKILEKISNLAIEPRPKNCIKLVSKDFYRIRIGRYRVLYNIKDKVLTIIVVKISHRKDAY